VQKNISNGFTTQPGRALQRTKDTLEKPVFGRLGKKANESEQEKRAMG
jgi:hypothetical protein